MTRKQAQYAARLAADSAHRTYNEYLRLQSLIDNTMASMTEQHGGEVASIEFGKRQYLVDLAGKRDRLIQLAMMHSTMSCMYQLSGDMDTTHGNTLQEE